MSAPSIVKCGEALPKQRLPANPPKFLIDQCPSEYRFSLNNTILPRSPRPCTTSPNAIGHTDNYKYLCDVLENRGIEGPRQLDYIYARGIYRERKDFPMLSVLRHDLGNAEITEPMLGHFGLLTSDPTQQRLRSSGGQGLGNTGTMRDRDSFVDPRLRPGQEGTAQRPSSSGRGSGSSRTPTSGPRNNGRDIHDMMKASKAYDWHKVSISKMYAGSSTDQISVLGRVRSRWCSERS